MKKRIVSILLAGTLVIGMLGLSGCTSSTDSQSSSEDSTEASSESGDDLLAQIQDEGKMTVAMEGTWAPWTYHDEETNDLVGYDVEVAQNIAEKLGVEAEFVEGEWDGLFAGLDSGRYDMVVNGVEVTDERSEKYDFSEPYCYIHTALIVSEENTDINSFEDLDGKTTANSIASTYMTLAESYGATATGVDSLEETMNMVLAGRADATLNADVSFYDYMNVHPEAALKVVATTDDASEVSIPLRKGAETESLREAINTAIEELRADGTLAELSEKYFGTDVSKES